MLRRLLDTLLHSGKRAAVSAEARDDATVGESKVAGDHPAEPAAGLATTATWQSKDKSAPPVVPLTDQVDSVPPTAGQTSAAAERVDRTLRLETTDAGSLIVAAPALPRIDGYRIEGVVGRGGMGVVYRATQLGLNRTVALKMIVAGAHATEATLARFRAEAEAVARLHHPNIVQIYQIGHHEGLPFFSFEFVEGGTLADRLRGTPMAPREAGWLVEMLARAMHAAHERGIIHRDLKPSNILIKADGTPKITDFGLAKRMEEDEDLTRTGMVLGTASYMAPEQAAGKGKHTGPACDVWALGAILYEALTGRPPFRGMTVYETLGQVRSQEPLSPSQLQMGLPADATTICLKCLQKEPERRYRTALELADDLQRFLNHEPIAARPIGTLERLQRWRRRNPATARAVALVAVVLIVTAVGATAAAFYLAHAARRTRLALESESHARDRAERILADMHTERGLLAAERGDPCQAVLWFANAARLSRTQPDRCWANQVRARAWLDEVTIPARVLECPTNVIRGLAFQPSGRFLLTIGNRDTRFHGARFGQWGLWDLDRGTALTLPDHPQMVICGAWSPDGQLLALGRPRPAVDRPGAIDLYRFPEAERVQQFSHRGDVRSVAFSPDGRYLAFGSETVRVWDIKQGDYATPELPHPRPVHVMAFSRKSDRLGTGCWDGQARVFAVPNNDHQTDFPPVRHETRSTVDLPEDMRGGSPIAPTFADDDRFLLVLPDDRHVNWHDATSGAVVRQVVLQHTSGQQHEISCVRASPDGVHVGISGFLVGRIFHARSAQPIGSHLERSNAMYSMAFHPTAPVVAATGSEGSAALWTVPEGKPIGHELVHFQGVNHVAFSSGGQWLATAQEGGSVRVWPTRLPRAPAAAVKLANTYNRARSTRDGRFAIAAGTSFRLAALMVTQVVEVATGKPAGPALRLAGTLLDAALAPATSVAALAVSASKQPSTRLESMYAPSRSAGTVQLWDWRKGELRWTAPMPSEPRSVDFAPGGATLAVLGAAGDLVLLDASTGTVIAKALYPVKPPPPARSRPGIIDGAGEYLANGTVRFTADGAYLLTYNFDSAVHVWHADTLQPRYPPLEHERKCHEAELSPDGTVLASCAFDSTVRFWDFATGKSLARPLPHPDWVFAVRFSTDGRWVVSACRDRRARLWDWRSATIVHSLRHQDEIFDAAFGSSDRYVVTTSLDRTVSVWETATGRRLMPPMTLVSQGFSVTRREGTDQFAIGGAWPATVYCLDLTDRLRPLELELAELVELGEIASGSRVIEGGSVPLTNADWIERHRRLRGARPELFPFEATAP